MNRKARGYNPRLSTPGRSRLNTDDWYNLMYQKIHDEYNQEINNSTDEKRAQYTETNFGDFMAAVDADKEEFAEKFLSPKIQDEEIPYIPEVVVSNKKPTEEQLNERRKVLKQKKWARSIGGEEFSKADERELNELDLWHKVAYANGYDTLSIPVGVNRNMTPEERAVKEAEDRLHDLGGAPKGYWLKSFQRGLEDSVAPVVGAVIGGPIGFGIGVGVTALYEALKKEPQSPNLVDDIATSFTRKANEIQILTSKGKIQRTQEMQLLAKNGLEDLIAAMNHQDELRRTYNALYSKLNIEGLTKEEQAQFKDVQKQLKDSVLEEDIAAKKLDTLASYDPENPLFTLWQKINWGLDIQGAPKSLDFLNRIDFAYDLGLRDDLKGMKNVMRKLRWARSKGDTVGATEALGSLQEMLSKFDKNAEYAKSGWNEDIKSDERDIQRIDDEYKVSEYYQIQDRLAQDLSLFSPKKILFSSAGLLGSSMSSTPKTLLKLGSIGLALSSNSWPALLGAGGINLMTGGVQATDENNAEVGGTYEISDYVQKLSTAGMLNSVLEDGRKAMNNPKADIEDILKAFASGEYMPINKNVREAFLNIIAGANQQWAYDMNATAPGVWTDAALTIIPTSYYTKAVQALQKVTTKPLGKIVDYFKLSKNPAFQREMLVGAEGIPEEELLKIQELAAKQGNKNPIILSAENKATTVADPTQKSKFTQSVEKLRDYFSNIGKLGKYIPTKMLTGPTSYPFRKAAKSFAARSIVGMSEEFWEEDVQSIRQHQRAKGGFGSEFVSGGYNPQLIFDNFVDGVKSSWDFIFKDAALATQEEKEIWKEAKLGALGWILQGGAPAFVRSVHDPNGVGVWKQYKTTDIIFSKILANKAENDSKIKQGIQFAKMAQSYSDYGAAMQAFDDIERWNADAREKNSDEGFPEEAISESREYYKTVSQLYHNPFIQNLLTKAGIKVGTDDYYTAVSLIARHEELLDESEQKTNDTVQKIDSFKQLLKSNVYFDRYMRNKHLVYSETVRKPEQIETPTGKIGGQKKKVLEEKQAAENERFEIEQQEARENWRLQQKEQYEKQVDDLFYLASVGSLIDQINTYESIETLSGKQSNFLKSLKHQLADINKEREDAGYAALNTKDDVMQYVADKDLYDYIADLYRQYDGFAQDHKMYEGVVNRLYSEEKIGQYKNAENVYPIKKLVEQYKKNQESDDDLYNKIETDYLNRVKYNQEIDDFFENTDINNTNNIYTGYDGTYAAEQEIAADGKKTYKKYKFDELLGEKIGSPMPFDKEEYYLYQKMQESEAEREQDANLTDEERLEIGKQRIAREERQRKYAEENRFSDEDYARMSYSEGELSDEESPQEYSERIRKEQEEKEAEALRKQEEKERARIEEEQRLKEENGWYYNEGEDQGVFEQQEAQMREIRDRNMKDRLERQKSKLSKKVQNLLDEGYTLGYEKTKRGKVIFYGKKGKSKIRITEDEYRDYLKTVNKTNGNAGFEYDPTDSNHLFSTPSADNGYSQIEALLLNSIYDGDESKFNDLLDNFKLVLTDEQIEQFRYEWLKINNTVAEERFSLEDIKDEKNKFDAQRKLFETITQSVAQMLNQFSTAWTRFGEILNKYSDEFVESLVDQFIQQDYAKTPQAKISLTRQKYGISPAKQVVALMVAGAKLSKIGKSKFVATDAAGIQYELTQFQYRFAEWLKRNLKFTEASLDFGENPQPTQEEILATIKKANRGVGEVLERITVGEKEKWERWAKQKQDEAISETQKLLFQNGLWLSPQKIVTAIGGKYTKQGVGNFGARSTSQIQDQVVSQIKKLAIKNNPHILTQYTTGLHYFYEKDGKIWMLDRAHTYLFHSDLHTKSNSIPEDIVKQHKSRVYSEIVDKLNTLTEAYSLYGDVDTKRELDAYIKHVQDTYNIKLAEKYGINSEIYKTRSINLEGYTKVDPESYTSFVKGIAYLGSYDDEHFSAGTRYLESGNIIDEIARLVCSDSVVWNKPEYKMSDETFNNLCAAIYRKKIAMEKIGLKIITDEIFLTDVDYMLDDLSEYVGGVTDMFAVDKQGRVYLIDFKTTSGFKMYSTVTGNEATRQRYSPEQVFKYNMSNDQNFEMKFDQQQIDEQYKKQLTLYKYLFEQITEIPIHKMYIAPIYVESVPGKLPSGQTDMSILGGILKNRAIPLRHIIISPAELSEIIIDNEDEDVDWSIIDKELDDINTKFEKTRSALRKHGATPDTLSVPFTDLTNRINALIDVIQEAKEGNTVPEDSLLSEIAEIKNKIDEFNNTARDFFKNNQPTPPTPPAGHQFNAQKRDATGELVRYNNIDSREQAFPKYYTREKIEDFKRVTALPDFIENSVWELNVKSYMRINGTVGSRGEQNPNINISITYTENLPNGKQIKHVFDNLLIQVAKELPDGTKITNQRKQNPLIQKIDSILFEADEQGNLKWKKDSDKIRIILTKKSRTNGKIKYSQNPQQDRKSAMIALGIKDDQLESLFVPGGNEVGIVGVTARGNLTYMRRGNRNERDVIYGVPEDRSLLDGIVAISLKLPYSEDGGDNMHTPIVPFTPKPLTPNDVDFYVDLMRNYGKYANQSFKIKIGDKEYDSPISAENLLYNILLRFGDVAEKTKNRFIFNFYKDPNTGKTDFSQVVGVQWNTENKTPIFNLRTDDGVNALKQYLLSGASVWYQNENMLLRGTTAKLDNTEKNPFLGVEKFFKDHPEINQIKYSDSLVFDRQDFDPKMDGSFDGIHGFTWMMRHGWMLSDYLGIEFPIMSVQDAEVLQDDTKSEQQIDDAPFVKEGFQNPQTDEDNTILDYNGDAELSDDLYDALLGGDTKIQKLPARTPIDEETAKKRIARILGKKFPVRFQSTVIEAVQSGGNVVGRLTKDGIILSKYAENGVEFHEAFHGVVEILLPDKLRKKLYEHYKDHYLNGAITDRTIIAEGLADLYYDFKIGTPEVHFTWNILKLFKNIYQYAKALATLDDIKIAALFAATDLGVMRIFKADENRFKQYMTRYKNGLNYTVKDDSGNSHILTHFGNNKQVKDIVDVIVYKLIHDAGIDLLAANIKSLDTRLGAIQTTLMATPEEKKQMQEQYLQLKSANKENAWDHVQHSKQYKRLVAEGVTEEQLRNAAKSGKISLLTERNILMFREMFDNWDVFRPKVEQRISSLGIDKRAVREQQLVEDIDGGEGFNQEEFGHYDQPFYEHSIRDDVPTKIRWFLSTRPNKKFADIEDVKAGRIASVYRIVNGERQRMIIDVKNNSIGYSTFQSYGSVYNKLLRLCHGARSLQELDDMLEKFGKTDYTLYNIHKSYHRFRDLMYNRWGKDDFGGEYKGKPKAMIRKDGKMVMMDPSEYNCSEFPQYVVYSHDVYDSTGATIHKAGEMIREALIVTNPDYEQLVSQLYQSIHAQHINFENVYIQDEVDQTGNVTGRRQYKVQSTSQDIDSQIYPKLWFNSLRSGWGGIFTTDESGNLTTVKDDNGNIIQTFGDTAKFLRTLHTSVTSPAGKYNIHNIPIQDQYYDLDNDEQFGLIELEFVQKLNQVGVQIDMSTLNYMLMLKYPTMSLNEAFAAMFKSTATDSIWPFIQKDGILDTLQTALNAKNYDLFFKDVKKSADTDPSGFILYGENGFLLELAKWSGRYRLANRDAMQIGPNNTKLYTFAQHHTASEKVIELNNVFDDNGNEIQNGLVADLIKSPYVLSQDRSRGSIVAKQVLNENFNSKHDRIKLATSEGIKLAVSKTGGTKYSETSPIEDWLSKAAILQNGNICFPTLSDKSTWFYLLGILLPGINYSSVDGRFLPKFQNGGSYRMFFNRDSFSATSKQQYFNDDNPVLDQLIEYAYCELDLINQTMNQLGIQSQNSTQEQHIDENQKINNFHTDELHGARFCFLTGVYGKYTPIYDNAGNEIDFVLDETQDEFYEFNKYDPADPIKSALDSRERAMRVFFDKRDGETDNQLRARQRAMIANMLQHRVVDQLNDLVKKGIIEEAGWESAKNYNNKYSSKVTPFLKYKNKLLDYEAIDALKQAYKRIAIGDTTYENVFNEQQLESAAIVAYVYDITAKSIMSKEETQRFFTGFPHFYKWKWDYVEDQTAMSLVNVMEDESKRLGGFGSTGTSNILDLPNIRKTYRCAEIKDWEIGSPGIESLSRAFTDNEYRDALVQIMLGQKATNPSFEDEQNLLVDEQSISGENIYSKGSEFAKMLSNFANIPFEYEGRKYSSVEHAYQTLKSGSFDEVTYKDFGLHPHGTKLVNTKTNFSLMVKLITEKLHQSPELLNQLKERGGEIYLAKSVHNTGSKTDAYWQTSGGKNRFIAALSIAYHNAKEYEYYNPEYLYTEFDAEDELDQLQYLLHERATQTNRKKYLSEDDVYDAVYSMPLYMVKAKLSNYENGKYKTIIDNKIEAEVKSFKKEINVADGAAYITDKMAEDLLRMRGAWNSDIQEAFEYLREDKIPFVKQNGKKVKKNYLNEKRAYEKIYNALIGAQKYSAFGYRMQNGLPVHFYNKYALFPIFKGISYGFTAELYKKMNDPEYGVDMVMMSSAVKVGNQAPQKFNPDMTEEELRNFSFKDHIYEQPFSAVRRQLNTDPHERDLMAMGTQAVKVILSIIRQSQIYTMQNGEQVRGRDIIARIMTAINKLADIGNDKLVDLFFDVDGDQRTLNYEKFAKFVEGELINRNADSNILDATRKLAEENKPILNSVSNMQWIESIIISTINKHIIDINLPGNAFYQRSVFGMEGLYGDDEFPILANGKPLRMINEEGSMDAAVSIDFFMNIIPKEYRYNFEKAKQWLIDNNIISGVRSWDTEWHNATANIVAYRIPTQAVSSIHAIRIVDVLPTLRDTIVLPKEFTKITGSDFDIDKLYLSMVKYNVTKIKYKSTVEFDNDQVEYEANRQFDEKQNPEEFYQNQLLETYLSLLKDTGKKISEDGTDERMILGKYIHLLHRPIDNDTDLIKKVLNKIESNKKKTPVEPFVSGSLYTQSNLKNTFLTAKFGIGPFALNNNSHILTTLYNVSFKHSDGILSLLNAESLHETNDRDGNSILSWMSALINAHVDAAKDPYILRMNVNKYTYNLVSLLIRLGFGKDAFYFIAQPILKDLALEYQNQNGEVVDRPDLSPTERWREAEKEFLKNIDFGSDSINTKIAKITGQGNAKYNSDDFQKDSAIFKALFGDFGNGYSVGSQSLLERLLTDRSLLIDKDGDFSVENMSNEALIKIGEKSYSAKQLQGYIVIAKKLFDPYGDALNTLVQQTKIDTKKHGISFMEQQQYLKRYNQLSNYSTNMFDANLETMLTKSFIDKKTKLAIGILPEILGQQMIHFTPAFQTMVDKIQALCNNKTTDTRKAIQQQLLSYIKQKCMNEIMDEMNIDFDKIIRGRDSLANRIEALKHKILAGGNPEYGLYSSNGVITNAILSNIHPVPYIREFGQDNYSLLQLDNTADDNPDIENDYIDSWEQMWNSQDEEIHNIARDLAIYAFMTSADNRGFNKFFKYVPLSLREDIGYVDKMNTMFNHFNTNNVLLTGEGSGFASIDVNEFFKNGWRNNRIIPVYKPKRSTDIHGIKFVYDDINRSNGEQIKRDAWRIFGAPFISKNTETGLFPQYIKMRRPYATTKNADPYLLYKLVQTGRTGDKEIPIYAITDAKGVSIKAGFQDYDLYEYDRDDQNSHVAQGYRLDDMDWNVVSAWIFGRITKQVQNRPTENEIDVIEATSNALSKHPRTGVGFRDYRVVTDQEGNQTISENNPYGYAQLVREMYYQEEFDTNTLRSNPERDDIKYSDRFMKFCKGL